MFLILNYPTKIWKLLGNNMAFFLNCKNVGMKMGIKEPEKIQAIHTNFIEV